MKPVIENELANIHCHFELDLQLFEEVGGKQTLFSPINTVSERDLEVN